MRPFTIGGFCNYIDITIETFSQWCKSDDLSDISTRIRQIIRNQKFEGAASGFFNANIIARDLGLKEHTDNKNENNEKVKISFK